MRKALTEVITSWMCHRGKCGRGSREGKQRSDHVSAFGHSKNFGINFNRNENP